MDTYGYMPVGHHAFRSTPLFNPLPVPVESRNFVNPFLLQPVSVRGAYSDDYTRRIMEQRHAMENSRGASKSCIERNTFPHKFKHIPREKSENDDENNDSVLDKCTICLCGK